jgi:hypothetical protein
VAIIETCLVDKEPHAIECNLLGGQNNFREPDEPLCDVERLLMLFEQRVVSLAFFFDGKGKRDEGWLTNVLRQRLFSQSAAEPTVAIFKGMDALKIKVVLSPPAWSC